jgi:hypothetical protein
MKKSLLYVSLAREFVELVLAVYAVIHLFMN